MLPQPDPTVTPVMPPMPGMGTGYTGIPMGMGAMGGYTGTDPYSMNTGSMAGMSGMGMGMCPMMSGMGMSGMGMSGMGMGYGMTGYPNYSLAGYWNGSYPAMGTGMMGYGGYPGTSGYNGTYPYMGSGMMGSGMSCGRMWRRIHGYVRIRDAGIWHDGIWL